MNTKNYTGVQRKERLAKIRDKYGLSSPSRIRRRNLKYAIVAFAAVLLVLFSILVIPCFFGRTKTHHLEDHGVSITLPSNWFRRDDLKEEFSVPGVLFMPGVTQGEFRYGGRSMGDASITINSIPILSKKTLSDDAAEQIEALKKAQCFKNMSRSSITASEINAERIDYMLVSGDNSHRGFMYLMHQRGRLYQFICQAYEYSFDEYKDDFNYLLDNIEFDDI